MLIDGKGNVLDIHNDVLPLGDKEYEAEMRYLDPREVFIYNGKRYILEGSNATGVTAYDADDADCDGVSLPILETDVVRVIGTFVA